MSWTSPLTVPIRNLPIGLRRRSRRAAGAARSIAPAIARPAISISGTKKSPRSNRAPTSSSEGISASKSRVCGSMPQRRGPRGSARARAGRCRPGSRRRAPCRISSGVMRASCATGASGVGWGSARGCDRAAAWTAAADWSSRCGRARRAGPPAGRWGPRCPSAATTLAAAAVTGTATPVSPTSSSSVGDGPAAAAGPRRPSRRRSSASASVGGRCGARAGPVGSGSTPQARNTLPSAEQWAGTSTSVQSRVPSR